MTWRSRIVLPAIYTGIAFVLIAGWLAVQGAGWVGSLAVLTGEVGPDGLEATVLRAVAALGAWFGVVLVAPALVLGALLDLATGAALRWRRRAPGEGRRRNQ